MSHLMISSLALIFILVSSGVTQIEKVDSLKITNKSTTEPLGFEISIEGGEKLPVSVNQIQKVFTEFFESNNLPVKKKSSLEVSLKFSEISFTKVSKLADLIRAEFNIEVRLLSNQKEKTFYSFSINCKGLENGRQKATEKAFEMLRMDERELDLLAKKLSELAGKNFY